MNKILRYVLIAVLTVAAGDAVAQQLRTSYFMDKSIVRNQMNPALRPARGYINIPVIGGLGVNFNSNALTVDHLFTKQNGKVVTFLDNSVDATQFLSKLKSDNQLDVDVATTIFGFGFYSGRGFWTFDVGTKVNSGVSLPKGLFEFAKSGSGLEGRNYDFKNLQMNATSYLDVALGYSRKIGDRLTIGMKVKYIAGIANVDMMIDEMNLNLGADKWEVKAKGTINSSMRGLEPTYDEKDSHYFDGFDLNYRKLGIGGHGFGVDLGASYQLLPNLTFSAAVVDLGLIRWSAKHTITGTSAKDYTFDGFDITEGGKPEEELTDEFKDLFRFKENASQDRTTTLRTTINVGGEYAFLNNQLSVGLLSSTQIRQTETYSELTVSGNWRPLSWLSATVSYSILKSDFKTFGCALNLSPSWINVYIGTDYLLGKVTPQFVPISQKCANFYFGLGIPLAKGDR